jgi:hypothetical protein
VESTFSITDVWQQPLFVFDWTLNFLEIEKMLQSCFYFWLILENRKIERAAIKDESFKVAQILTWGEGSLI